MSKVSNALNMYFFILGRNKVSVSEIARELEMSTRMVKQYKKDLEMAGIYIDSKFGRDGGYFLDTKRCLSGINLTEDEVSAIKMAKETIKSGNYHYSTKFEIVVNKILKVKEYQHNSNYHNKLLIESDEVIEGERAIWSDVNIAISHKNKLKIKYKSLKKHCVEIKERTVSPYGVFDYRGATYFYGYCEVAENIRFFKLSRVIEYEVLKEKFEIKIDFDFYEVKEKSFGIYNDETINLEILIKYPMSEIIKEKVISKNQKITDIDEKTICFKAEMKGYQEIKTWVMSMGSKAEVISPIKLKEDIINENKEISKLYKRNI